MKTQNIKSTSKRVRTTKADKAGLSLPIPPLFQVTGNTFIYYNESPFIQKLKRIKFKFVGFFQPFYFSINLGCFPKKITHNGMIAFVSHSNHQLIFDF